MKETSPKSNNGTILDINESFKIEFDPISDALAAIRNGECIICLLYTSPSPRDYAASRMPSSA